MQTPELILAVDVPDAKSLSSTLSSIPNQLRWLKIGLELFCAEGPSILAAASVLDRQIFLDLKLHDIPRTVERAVVAAARHRVRLLTIHAGGGRAMVQAAAQAARQFGQHAPKIIAVTVLTSLNDQDMQDAGVSRTASQQVMGLADLALAAGADGLVCSPREVASLRARFGAAPLLVVPGIRAANDGADDQKRTATAAEATRAGASYLVVGRPILAAADPHAATLRMLEEIRAAS
jgi:orotidine-5'-phosphate decarboxylase